MTFLLWHKLQLIACCRNPNIGSLGLGQYYLNNIGLPIQVSTWNSDVIRSSFLSFFKERNHKYIPSTTVIAWDDQSLDFVNAGMNQFKSVFLGKMGAPVDAAVNFQKCIRVGGKHNDLKDVGNDTYHHTFFEMLGNWSFQSYSKEAACQMSWELLTKVFKIKENHLYVTYFGGDENLQLSADFEVQEIWKRIGVPSERILPFGLEDNFWEMGSVGPCGPCTEIHYERHPSSHGSSIVNKGSEDLIELWNLVFIQYQRSANGAIIPLDSVYIDTGMGLERLAAILNNKTSNYDTDLFIPLFEIIQKASSKPKYTGKFNARPDCLDTYYRILADHSRMITSALSDGLLPQDSENLRRVIRRSLLIGWEKFGFDHKRNWLGELCEGVSKVLGSTYPELNQKLANTKLILEYEAETLIESQIQILKEWQEITTFHPELLYQTNRSPQLINGIKSILPNLKKWRDIDNKFPISEALQMCKNYNLKPSIVEEVIQNLNLKFNYEQFQKCLKEDEHEKQNRSMPERGDITDFDLFKNISDILGITDITNDSFKYNYTYHLDGSFECQPLISNISAIINKRGQTFKEVESKTCSDCTIGIILNSTNFYSQAGGQSHDIGIIQAGDSRFKVNKVVNLNGYVVHYGEVSRGSFKTGDSVELHVNKGWRASNSKNHTAHHLLISAIKSITGMCYQRESKVTNKELVVDVFTHPPIKLQQIIEAEEIVKLWISQGMAVTRKKKFLHEALKENASVSSGEKYPVDVFVVNTSCEAPINTGVKFTNEKHKIISSELCCGTHVHNTSNLGAFAIINILERANGVTRITGVCGKEASKLIDNVVPIKKQLDAWEFEIMDAIKTDVRLRNMRADFKKWKQAIKKSTLPATFYLQLVLKYEHLTELIDEILIPTSNSNELLLEFRNVIPRFHDQPIIHKMEAEYRGNLADLENIIQEVKDRPAAFVCSGWGRIRVCVFIPKETSGEENVQKLLASLEDYFGHGSNRLTTVEAGTIGSWVLNGIKAEKRSEMENLIIQFCTNFIYQL